MSKRLVLCTAEFATEEEAEAFGKRLDQLDLTHVVCGNRVTVEHTGEDWMTVISLFEPLAKRSIVAKFDEDTTVNVRM